MLDACTAMCDIMKKLGIAVDGGKDSLSMAARVRDETVKAPGILKRFMAHPKRNKYCIVPIFGGGLILALLTGSTKSSTITFYYKPNTYKIENQYNYRRLR
jgi:phosphoribosylformylglycinamidine (FGAM) synthase-like enzyme